MACKLWREKLLAEFLATLIMLGKGDSVAGAKAALTALVPQENLTAMIYPFLPIDRDVNSDVDAQTRGVVVARDLSPLIQQHLESRYSH